jgi:hypothetical protein
VSSNPTAPLGTSRYASQTFTGVDQAKWDKIVASVKNACGIDMSTSMGSVNSPATASKSGITISWVYSQETQTLVVDLVDRKFYDPSEQEIDQRIANWITSV